MTAVPGENPISVKVRAGSSLDVTVYRGNVPGLGEGPGCPLALLVSNGPYEMTDVAGLGRLSRVRRGTVSGSVSSGCG